MTLHLVSPPSDASATSTQTHSTNLIDYANLKLAALGQPLFVKENSSPSLKMACSLFRSYRQRIRSSSEGRCPVDQRIQNFLNAFFDDLPSAESRPQIPSDTLTLDSSGLARTLSLPPDRDHFTSDIVSSYRVRNGVLHNPKNDRRTTKGAFHIAEGGLPIPDDKKAVPKLTFARLLDAALTPPRDLLCLPFTDSQPHKAYLSVSLLLRPIVSPPVPGFLDEKTLESRFFAPGALVANLDFVESIFGNAGDPYLPENDAGLDVNHWTGHTGCVILAPHLIQLMKKDLGLPHADKATPRQRRDGMFWESEDECYNDGVPFKITARDRRGVIVTLIADNYFGYCKKEIKTQISYAANLYGMCEEEHAGGALVYPSYDLGEDFHPSEFHLDSDYTFAQMATDYADWMNIQPEGYAIDKRFPNILYLPENVHITLDDQLITWEAEDHQSHRTLKLLPDYTYVLPSGYKIRMLKPAQGRRWRLVGTTAEPTFCHKPCTVSGGGKSEISKPIADAIIDGPFYISDLKKDLDHVEAILNKDYSQRFRHRSSKHHSPSRSLLAPNRSLGSVIQLLTPSPEKYSDDYNAWLETLSQDIKDLVLLIKRFYKPDWGTHWCSRFSVDLINGAPGKELRYRKHKIITDYLRVGFTTDGSWRTFGLRKDFFPAVKIAQEDDISASVVLPSACIPTSLGSPPHSPHSQRSVKLVANCENRLFQRPDDAITRGYDKRTEADFSRTDNFLSNYEPLTSTQARALVQDPIRFEQYTPRLQAFIRDFAEQGTPDYIVSSAHPRSINGAPSKNPRYLQPRPDHEDPRAVHLAEIGVRLHRRLHSSQPLYYPVDAILPGRRNNPPDPTSGLRPLCVFNPIHYLELPELFMEFIASLTGKSPSTTGAGSEGALTKAPFNALLPIHDLNSALTAYLLTGAHVFVTAAGHIGPHYRVDHDISLFIPEIWCRMRAEERDPVTLIAKGFLEKCQDFTHNRVTVHASRLGYRITSSFVRHFGGRIFNNPACVFTDEMLQPELQDLDVFADGMDNIVTAHKHVAEGYFRDGSIDAACPPLKALLHIMAYGEYKGQTLQHPEFRAQFTREAALQSDWYQERLVARQKIERGLCQRHLNYLEAFLKNPLYREAVHRLKLSDRLNKVREQKKIVDAPDSIDRIKGTVGAQPSLCKASESVAL